MGSDQIYDVLIAGAGPIGLFLASELAMRNTSVLILERDASPINPWKAMPLGRRGLNTGSVECFYRRGLLDQIVDNGSERPWMIEKTGKFQFAGHFAGMKFDASKLELERWKYKLPGPALVPGPTNVEKLEGVLTERAEKLGVRIVRGQGVTEIVEEDDHSITVRTSTDDTYRGQWLVGCDGGRSAVRKAAGFDFVGTDPRFTGYCFKGTFDHPERLQFGFHNTSKGMYIVAGVDNIYLTDFDGGSYDRSQEITKEHLQDVMDRVTERNDVKITELEVAASWGDRTQGLNVGVGDAMNLGWKLAATIRQEKQADSQPDLTLLDTYESERHPIGAWVLEWTRAQVSTLQPDLFGSAVQHLMRDLIDTVDGTNLLIGRVWGLDQRYDLDTEGAYQHPLVGCSAPDFEFLDGSGLGQKITEGRGLLLDVGNDTALQALVQRFQSGGKVDHLGLDVKDKRGLRAILIRPDGIVAWVAEETEKPDVDGLKSALARWYD